MSNQYAKGKEKEGMISSQGTKHFRWPSHLIFYVYKAYCNPDKMCGIKEIRTLKKTQKLGYPWFMYFR